MLAQLFSGLLSDELSAAHSPLACYFVKVAAIFRELLTCNIRRLLPPLIFAVALALSQTVVTAIETVGTAAGINQYANTAEQIQKNISLLQAEIARLQQNKAEFQDKER